MQASLSLVNEQVRNYKDRRRWKLIFLSVASLSHVGHFIQYHRNTTPDSVGCVTSRSRGCYGSVCVKERMGVGGLN